MKKTIEREFFKAFQLGGVVSECFSWIQKKYDLEYDLQDENEKNNLRHSYFEIELPMLIKREAECFLTSIIISPDSPLLDEMSNNLFESKSQKDKENYAYSLLRPFKEYGDIFHPIACVKRLEHEINQCKNDLKRWNTIKNADGIDIDSEIEACKRDIEENENQIQRIYHIRDQIFKIAHQQKHEKGTVEYYFSKLMCVVCLFAHYLDALLLMNELDLMRLQTDSGIYLKTERNIIDIAYPIGSIELAQKCIDGLPKIKMKQELIKLKSETSLILNCDAFPNPQNLAFQLNNNELLQVFDEVRKPRTGIILENTDFDYFAYAITGKAIPEEKQPYKPIALKGTKDQLYRCLFDLQNDIDQKTLTNSRREKAGFLFSKNGKAIGKLSNPK